MAIPLDLLDDLCTRFLLNVPAHELDTAEKAMFIVEQAHWYYEDFCRDADPSLPSLSLRAFAHALAAHCPEAFGTAFGSSSSSSSSLIIHDVDAAMAQFNAFKAQVPTAGAALLDPTMTKVLMVKGYKKDASWGFPRGKLSKGETAAECAAREVLEETGIDVSDSLLDDDNPPPRIEINVNSQLTTLFVVAGAASEETPVAALVRGEIGGIAWHMLADLPSTREAGALTYRTATGAKHRFWRVWPYIKPLRSWVRSQQQQQQRQQRSGGKGGAASGGAKKKGGAASASSAAAATSTTATTTKRTKSSGALAATGGGAAKAEPTTPAKKKRRERGGSKASAQGARRAAAPAAAAEHLLASSTTSTSTSTSTSSKTAAPGEKVWLDFRFDRAPILEALRS